MLNASYLARTLTERFGVSIGGQAADESDGKHAIFRPLDIPATQGFSIDVLIGWRTVEARFAPGSFAAQLLGSMGRATPDQRAMFGAFVLSALNNGAAVTFRINNVDADPLQPTQWPDHWHLLALTMVKGPTLIDAHDPSALDALALTWSSRLLGAVLSLIPLEAVEPGLPGEPEGGGERVVTTRYERSQINRAACVEIQGIRCKACAFDFALAYGEIGEGFIEVHHIEPVSDVTRGTIVNPAKDLVPVCPNCHAMLHRRKPPYSIDELQAIIQRAKAHQSGARIEDGGH